MAGKGSARRPAAVSDSDIQASWDRIFGNKNTQHSGELGRYIPTSRPPERLTLCRPCGGDGWITGADDREMCQECSGAGFVP